MVNGAYRDRERWKAPFSSTLASNSRIGPFPNPGSLLQARLMRARTIIVIPITGPASA